MSSFIQCDNCGKRFRAGEIVVAFPCIPDLTERVSPGEVVPFGECNDCGCLFDYDFKVPIWKCMLPRWIKAIVFKYISEKAERQGRQMQVTIEIDDEEIRQEIKRILGQGIDNII